MNLSEIIHGEPNNSYPLQIECSEFLKESENLPLFKNLPSQYEDFQKVKIRQRSKKDRFAKTFNETFADFYNLVQRSLFANGSVSFIEENGEYESFYVFPIDGYKYKYSLEVSNSKDDYKEAFDIILEQLDNHTVIQDLFKYTYTSENLVEGIEHGSEIIFYNIPYFYALRMSAVHNYSEFIQNME